MLITLRVVIPVTLTYPHLPFWNNFWPNIFHHSLILFHPNQSVLSRISLCCGEYLYLAMCALFVCVCVLILFMRYLHSINSSRSIICMFTTRFTVCTSISCKINNANIGHVSVMCFNHLTICVPSIIIITLYSSSFMPKLFTIKRLWRGYVITLWLYDFFNTHPPDSLFIMWHHGFEQWHFDVQTVKQMHVNGRQNVERTLASCQMFFRTLGWIESSQKWLRYTLSYYRYEHLVEFH